MLAMNAGRRIRPSYGAPQGAASVRAALRQLRSSGISAAPASPPLELTSRADQPPRLEAPLALEGATLVARVVPGAPVAGFTAFLDGVQRSQVIAYAGAMPVVHGAVAAVVRERVARRLRTWRTPRVIERLYAPLSGLDPALALLLRDRSDAVDPFEGEEPSPLRHPQECTARALTAIQRAREGAELALLDAWLAVAGGPILVDGGISGSRVATLDPRAVGVVKSHRTLYATTETLPTILGLGEGERTTAVGVTSPRRFPVATWYLRLRDPGSGSPFFGLVRVEVAREGDVTARADEVSRWLLAERSPVALPDPRWDVMSYGVRDCEQYLSAIIR